MSERVEANRAFLESFVICKTNKQVKLLLHKATDSQLKALLEVIINFKNFDKNNLERKHFNKYRFHLKKVFQLKWSLKNCRKYLLKYRVVLRTVVSFVLLKVFENLISIATRV